MLHPAHGRPDRANGILRAVWRFVCPYEAQKAPRGVVLGVRSINAIHRQPMQSFIVIDPQRHIPMIPILVPVELCHDTFLSVGFKEIRILLRGVAILETVQNHHF